MAALTLDIFPVPPMLWIPNQQELAYNGQDVVLVCHIEAYPKSINYWTTAKGDMIISGIYDHKKRKEKKEPGPHNGTISGVKQKENSSSFSVQKKFEIKVKALSSFHLLKVVGSNLAVFILDGSYIFLYLHVLSFNACPISYGLGSKKK